MLPSGMSHATPWNPPPAKFFYQSNEAFRRVREAVIKEAEELPQGLYGSARASDGND
jgi:hypothetical protein